MSVVVERLHDSNLLSREEPDRADADKSVADAPIQYRVYDDGDGVNTFTRGTDDPLSFLPQIGSPHPDPAYAADGMVCINPRIVLWHTPNSCICELEFAFVDPDDVWEWSSNRTTRRVPRSNDDVTPRSVIRRIPMVFARWPVMRHASSASSRFAP